jgi:hypothetical protein
MDSSELEKIQLEVIKELRVLSRDHLVDLCVSLTIAGAEFEHVTGKGRAALITLISNYIQSEELGNLEDEGMSRLLHLQYNISELQTAAENGTLKQVSDTQEKQNDEEERILREIEVLQLQLANTQKPNDKQEMRVKNMAPTRKLTQITAHPHALSPMA